MSEVIKSEDVKPTTVKLKLGCTFNTDKDGNIVKDERGNITYERYDTLALSQMLNAIDIRTVPIDKHIDWLSLAKKIREAWRSDAVELELSVGEVSFLRDFVNLKFALHQEVKILGTFYAEALHSVREQLK